MKCSNLEPNWDKLIEKDEETRKRKGRRKRRRRRARVGVEGEWNGKWEWMRDNRGKKGERRGGGSKRMRECVYPITKTTKWNSATGAKLHQDQVNTWCRSLLWQPEAATECEFNCPTSSLLLHPGLPPELASLHTHTKQHNTHTHKVVYFLLLLLFRIQKNNTEMTFVAKTKAPCSIRRAIERTSKSFSIS